MLIEAKGICALCDQQAELRESHIIPKFVFTWLKETGGPIRSVRAPNRRVQDGEKQRLLCSNCEGLFSNWEKAFCEGLFLPVHSATLKDKPIVYGAWALKFAVSVSWRVLLHYHLLNDLAHFSEKQREASQKALCIWRKFLLGEVEHPGPFEQHVLIVDVIKNYSGPKISPFLNRYFMRNVEFDAIRSNKSAMVYSKMGRLIIFGFIQEPLNTWRGTKLHLSKGSILQRDCHVPQKIANYWNRKADESAKSLASISPEQSKRIQEYIRDNSDELANSDVFRAMKYDVHHSGTKAFNISKSTDNR